MRDAGLLVLVMVLALLGGGAMAGCGEAVEPPPVVPQPKILVVPPTEPEQPVAVSREPTIAADCEPGSAGCPEAAAAAASCRYGDLPACTRLCDAGDEQSCGHLAAMYVNGEGVDKDLQKGKSLAERACNSGSGRGCNVLAYLLERGLAGPPDEPRARQLYARACREGETRACLNLGRAWHYGISGAAVDHAQAYQLFKQACDGGLAEGCTAQAALAFHGQGTKADPAAAAVLYEKGCSGGDPNGCNGLAVAYARGAGVPQDTHRAFSLFEQACGAGSGAACKGIGDMHLPQDASLAADYYRRSCELKDLRGCAHLGVLLVEGNGVDQDRSLGLGHLQKACKDDSYGWACAELTRLGAPSP